MDLDIKDSTEWDGLYRGNTNEAIWGDEPADYLKDEGFALLSPLAGKEVLVLPCGDGRNVIPLTFQSCSIFAADISKSALELLGYKVKKLNINNCILHNDNIYKTQWEDKKFDHIISWDVLSHLDSPLKAIEEMLRLLKANGKLILNAYSVKDSTLTDHEVIISENTFLSNAGIMYKYYNDSDLDELLSSLNVLSKEYKEINWVEEPHKGYREYKHTHYGYAIVIQK
jgi:ubiquinone/menaquinone biosynthesis C-methylase UbiE